MPGRPRTRAKKLAALMAEGQALQVEPAERPDWGLPAPKDDDGSKARDKLSTWWRGQMQHSERAHAQRQDMLAAVRDMEHPNIVFAQQVRMFSAQGMPRDVVATLLMMAESEVELYYGDDFRVGSAELLGQVAQKMAKFALADGDPFVQFKACVEILNRRGGEEWRAPAQKLEIDDSRKKKRGRTIDASKMSWEDRQTLREVIERYVAKDRGGGVAGTLVEGAVAEAQG
jgi:hypothetical protein